MSCVQLGNAWCRIQDRKEKLNRDLRSCPASRQWLFTNFCHSRAAFLPSPLWFFVSPIIQLTLTAHMWPSNVIVPEAIRLCCVQSALLSYSHPSWGSPVREAYWFLTSRWIAFMRIHCPSMDNPWGCVDLNDTYKQTPK